MTAAEPQARSQHGKGQETSEACDSPFRSLPPPRTFAEGQRLVYGRLAAAAGMFCGTCSVLLVCLLTWGGWSPAEEHTIVVIFGGALGGFIAAMTSVMVGLLVGGPVGRFKWSATRDGRFPLADRELATEQAIQLDELIKWVKAQALIQPNAP